MPQPASGLRNDGEVCHSEEPAQPATWESVLLCNKEGVIRMKIAIGSDKSGFSAKEAIKAYLTESGADFADLGTLDLDHVHPYYEVANTVAPLVQNGSYDRAILICGTGAGMCVVSNKFKGVYAVACEGVYSAKMARAINNANILCMGGWIVGPEMAVEMTKTFLATDWCQDLEDWRAANMHKFAVQVSAIEDSIYGK